MVLVTTMQCVFHVGGSLVHCPNENDVLYDTYFNLMFTYWIGPPQTLKEEALKTWQSALQDYWKRQYDAAPEEIRQKLASHNPRKATHHIVHM